MLVLEDAQDVRLGRGVGLEVSVGRNVCVALEEKEVSPVGKGVDVVDALPLSVRL